MVRSRNNYDQYWNVSDSDRVLIIAITEYDAPYAPSSLPHQFDEVVEALKAFFEPVPMFGRITERMLADELRKGAAGFWFAGHAQAGAEGGLLLSDGFLPARTLGRYLGRGGVQWSYLNTCDSGSFVEELQAVHPHDVFANIVQQVGDEEAAKNGREFAQGIADSGSLIAAYRWVVRGVPSVLRMFPNPDGAGVIRDRTDSIVKPAVEDRLRRLEQVVFGDIDAGLPSWIAQSKTTDARLRRIEWSLIAFVVIIAMSLAFRWNLPKPQVIYMIATPTPIFDPYQPGSQP